MTTTTALNLDPHCGVQTESKENCVSIVTYSMHLNVSERITCICNRFTRTAYYPCLRNCLLNVLVYNELSDRQIHSQPIINEHQQSKVMRSYTT